MKKVAIYGQSYSIYSKKELIILLDILNKNKVEIFIEKEFYKLIYNINTFNKNYKTFNDFKDLSSDFDLMLTIGGDGTILRAITFIRHLNIPLLGINTGRLGFLATVNKGDINKIIKFILNKEYFVRERTLLQIDTIPKINSFSQLNFALNEVTIARRNTTSMIGIKAFLNKEYLTNYWADGLIVSTPTGSTGYSLSCNGPVVLPNTKSLVIAPIAPHNLNVRPMIISDNTSIKLEVSSREKDFLISLDSRITTVDKKTKVFIKKANFTIKTIVPKNQSYLKTLRDKLLWGEDTRNENIKSK